MSWRWQVVISMREFVWLYEDRVRNLALIRGVRDKAIFSTAGINDSVRWSTTGKGWVMPLGDVADLCAAFDLAGIVYRFKQVAG